MYRWLLVGMLWVGGCAAKRASAQRVDTRILAADRLWDNRDEDGFEPVESSLVDTWHRRGDEPEVVWRLVRLHVVRGLMEPSRRAAIDRYAEARALGIRCLESSPAFEQRRSEVSLKEALRFLDERRMPCVTWTTLAWSRWMAELGGDATAMDLDDLDAMITFALDGEDEDQRAIAQWSKGLVAASRPSWAGGDRDAAKSAMARAVEVAPDELWRQVDLLRLVAVPQEDSLLEASILADLEAANPQTPEDRAAVAWRPVAED